MNIAYWILFGFAISLTCAWCIMFIIDFRRRRKAERKFDAFLARVESQQMTEADREAARVSVWEQVNTSVWAQVNGKDEL